MNKTVTSSGLEILMESAATVKGQKVMLTRKTNKAGEIRHGVVLESARGFHKRVGTFEGLAPAFRLYKVLAV